MPGDENPPFLCGSLVSLAFLHSLDETADASAYIVTFADVFRCCPPEGQV